MFEDGKENVAYESDIVSVARIPSGAVKDDIALFGQGNELQDSGKKVSDFVLKSELEDSVESAVSDIWSFIRNEYAVAAYKDADEWDSSIHYDVGDFCVYDGDSYRCTAAHTSGASFDSDSWQLVLTEEGRLAIDSLLADYSNDGLAALTNVAPAFGSSVEYKVGDLTVKDGVLSVCTQAGRGDTARFSSDTNVFSAISELIDSLKDDIPSKVSELQNDAGYLTAEDLSGIEPYSGFLDQKTIEAPYDQLRGYEVGEKCTYGGRLYECAETVLSGEPFDPESWALLTVNEEIERVADSIPTDLGQLGNNAGYVKQDIVADPFDTSSHGYSVGEACTHNGKLYECTSAVSMNGAWNASDWTEKTVHEEIESLRDDIPSKVSDLQNDSGFAIQVSIDDEFDQSERYEVGDTCTHGGKFYKCKQVKIAGAAWDESANWTQISVTEYVADKLPKDNSELTNGSGFVRQTSVDAEYDRTRGYAVGETCTHDGIWYKCTSAVSQNTDFNESYWTEITVKEEIAAIDDLKMRIVRPSPSTYNGSYKRFQLVDNAVNVISLTDAVLPEGYTVILVQPSQPSDSSISRGYVILFDSSLSYDTVVEIEGVADCLGKATTITAFSSTSTYYRVTEVDSGEFVATGANNPAEVAVREIDRALDDILAGYGYTVPIERGIYIYNEEDHKYYKLVAVSEGGEVNIGVDQTGVSLEPDSEESPGE